MHIAGFGSLPAAGWRGQRGREVVRMTGGETMSTATVYPWAARAPSTIQQNVLTQQKAAEARFFKGFPVATLGQPLGLPMPGGPAASAQSPGFQGLGAIGCRDVEPLMQELKNLLDTSGHLMSESSRVSAQAVYDDIDSYALYIPYLGSDCGKHISELTATIAALRAELGYRAPPPIRPNATVVTGERPYQPPNDPSSELPFWAKAAIVGGIGVTGLIAVAVITGQVAPLFRAAKKVF